MRPSEPIRVGASRGRLIRQLVTEAFVIAQLAGFLSLLVTWWILKVLVRVIQSYIYKAGMSAGGTVLVNVTPDPAQVFLHAALDLEGSQG